MRISFSVLALFCGWATAMTPLTFVFPENEVLTTLYVVNARIAFTAMSHTCPTSPGCFETQNILWIRQHDCPWIQFRSTLKTSLELCHIICLTPPSKICSKNFIACNLTRLEVIWPRFSRETWTSPWYFSPRYRRLHEPLLSMYTCSGDFWSVSSRLDPIVKVVRPVSSLCRGLLLSLADGFWSFTTGIRIGYLKDCWFLACMKPPRIFYWTWFP